MDAKSLVTVRQSANERLTDNSVLACIYVLWGLIARPTMIIHCQPDNMPSSVNHSGKLIGTRIL